MNELEKPTYWQYERLQEDGKVKAVGINCNDTDGKLTGHPGIYGVKEWLDENPEEARRLGWVKHIQHNVDKWLTYNKQTQYVMKSHKIIDEFTYEDEYHVLDKTEDMMRRAEESGGGEWVSTDGIIWEV